MTDRHLTEEAFILLATGDCCDDFRREAASHLQSCARCQYESQQVYKIFGAIEQASEHGLLCLPRERSTKSLFNWKKSAFPWVPVGSILGASVVVIFAILGPFTAPSASASELLNRAVINERQFGAPGGFDIVANGVRCGHGGSAEKTLVEDSPTCQQVKISLNETPWAAGNPLAATTFRAWHASLANYRDTVTKLPALWTIDTSTSSGAIRNARLTLRKDTYQSVRLDLLFEDAENVTIEEDDQPIANAPLTAIAQTRPRAPAIQASSSVDLLEVQGWQILHNLNGDTGWEATVTRRGDSVIVRAEVPTPARKQEFEMAFASYPRIVLNVYEYGDSNAVPDFLPRRVNEPDGAPPLAKKWLDERFPDPGERSQFVNSTVKLSKEILGRVYVLEELEKRRTALANCSCAHALDSLIEAEKTDLRAAQESLRSSLEPVVGAPQHASAKEITVAGAQRLDVGIVRLFFTAPLSGDVTLDGEESAVRKLL